MGVMVKVVEDIEDAEEDNMALIAVVVEEGEEVEDVVVVFVHPRTLPGLLKLAIILMKNGMISHGINSNAFAI